MSFNHPTGLELNNNAALGDRLLDAPQPQRTHLVRQGGLERAPVLPITWQQALRELEAVVADQQAQILDLQDRVRQLEAPGWWARQLQAVQRAWQRLKEIRWS
jgi:hypothetical protein